MERRNTLLPSLSFGTRLGSGAERRERRLRAAYQRGQLLRLKRKCRIRPAVGAPQREVLFDQASAQRDGSDGDINTQRMIGKPDRQPNSAASRGIRRKFDCAIGVG